MILDALATGDDSPITLLFGVRYAEDRLYLEELEALVKAYPNFHVAYTLSQPPAGWIGRHGYVQTHVEELRRDLEARGVDGPHAYICGLERMVARFAISCASR